jgi:protease I
MDLTGKKIAIMLDEQYQEMEVWYPYYRFIEAGADVDLVAPETGKTYNSKLGYPCTSTKAAGEVRGGDYDCVVIPGGWCPDFMRRDPSMVSFIQQCAAAEIILAAICHGGWMLCCTDALKGRKATSFMAIEHDMRNAGAEWIDRECVVDGNVITARKPDDLPAFCTAVMNALGG